MNAVVDRSVAGDDDVWMLFDRLTADGYPLVIRTRTGNPLVEATLRQGLVTIVHCEADIASVRDDGMPPIENLYAVEDRLAVELQAFDIGAFHVASVTGDGQRRIIFAHEHPLEFEPLLALFSVPGVSLRASKPDDRGALIDLVTPTEVERQLNGDLGVISSLEKNGDFGVASRKTDFWFYGHKANLNALAEDLAAHGYTVDHWLTEREGVVFTRTMSVEFDTFREITPELIEAARRHGVEYDGWETMVVSVTANVTDPPQEPKTRSLLSKLFGLNKS